MALGAALLAAFYSLPQTATGLRVTFFAPPTRFAPGELYFWAAWMLFAVPGGAALGWGLGGGASEALARLGARAAVLGARGQRALLGLGFALGLAVYGGGRWGYLRGLPITDDEYAARFGGQLLASGGWLAPPPAPWGSFSELFLYAREGLVTSFEYPGVVLAWAAAERSGLEGHLFTLAAALTLPAVVWAARRRWGWGWGWVAGGLYLASPMATVMSWSTHAQVLSRLAVAALLGLWSWSEGAEGEEAPVSRRWLVVGLALSAGALLRPPEVACLLAPLGIAQGWRALRGAPGARVALGWLALGLLPALGVFAWHNLAVTGSVWEMPRFAASVADLSGRSGWESLVWRFGANLSPNLLALAVTFLGPVGLGLVGLGVGAGRFERLLLGGVGLTLLLALLHDHQGLHIAGPMHYTECAPVLALVAASGLRRAASWLQERALAPSRGVGALGGALLAGGLVFSTWQGAALRRSNALQADLYAVVDSAPVKPAVVFAPRFGAAWLRTPRGQAVGTWVFEWRRPHPQGEPVLILHDAPAWREAAALRFPERTPYTLEIDAQGQARLQEDGGPGSLTPGRRRHPTKTNNQN